MAEINSMNRESKKRQLRRQVVTSQGARQEEENSEEVVRLAHQKIRRRRLLLLTCIVLVAAVGVTGWFYYRQNYQFTGYEVVWEEDLPEGSLVGYETFGSNVLKYTKDGASYMDNRGRLIWNESYEMKSPVASVNGDYAVVADKQGNSIYIYSKDGFQGKATTVLPVSKVTVSGTGIVAAVLEESASSYINFFRKDGTVLDVAVKTNMGGDGYPLDIALSRDGTQLICSYVHIQKGEVKSRVVFYDFSEVGKNVPNRLVGGFDEPFANTLVARVQYLGEPYSCAFSGNGLTFFSSKNLASPEQIKQVEVEEEIECIFYSDDYAGMIVKNYNSDSASRMELYKKNGELVMKKEFTYDYTQVDIDGNMIIMYNDDSCKVFNLAGAERFSGEFDFPVLKIRQKTGLSNTLIVTGPQTMKEVKLH